ncbi:hypothetical protein [Mucilaginibacter paludis]|uniref:Uncharacterized protein n=1 Tax=Mucilaginibacter paludis DSM 18603 TaxID=714943 RepID=H1Y8T6_9SPHI|nr:hypothetical protein [Mucilaginibacter paludis]EHQ28702.1 hypothetical protein Mucpa_4613 [Mucilaginibacter paludis DSM 18603]
MSNTAINEAITNYICLPWISNDAKNSIRAAYGTGMLELIEEIYLLAANDTIWIRGDYLSARSQCATKLITLYPFLSEAAANTIANMAAYSWR